MARVGFAFADFFDDELAEVVAWGAPVESLACLLELEREVLDLLSLLFERFDLSSTATCFRLLLLLLGQMLAVRMSTTASDTDCCVSIASVWVAVRDWRRAEAEARRLCSYAADTASSWLEMDCMTSWR